MLTPASRAAVKPLNCCSVQYSEWPEMTSASWSSSSAGMGGDLDVIGVGDVVALLLQPGEQVEVGAGEPVELGAGLGEGAVEGDLDRAVGARGGVAAFVAAK